MRRRNQLIEGIAQLLCVGDLFLLILLLQDSVEVRYNIAVYLATRQHKRVSDERSLLTWSAQSRQWARSFASAGSSAVPSFASSSCWKISEVDGTVGKVLTYSISTVLS
jgi:hypothetical protein